MIPDDDRGLTLGDGLFETLLAQKGELILFDAHIARMTRGAATLGLPAPDIGRARDLAREALAEAGLEASRAAVRLTYTAGSGGRGLDRPQDLHPRLVATAAAAPETREPIRLATVSVRRNSSSPASRLKTLAYLDNVLARREARAVGADEALMLNERGEIAGAAAANLFWIEASVILTPELDCGVLDGVIRGEILARAGGLGFTTRTVRASVQALEGARAMFITNSLIGVRPIREWNGRVLDDHAAIGAITKALTGMI